MKKLFFEYKLCINLSAMNFNNVLKKTIFSKMGHEQKIYLFYIMLKIYI